MAKPVRTLIDALERVADRERSGYTYADEDGTTRFESFRELHGRACRIGCALQAHGLGKGDRLGLILLDSRQFIDAFFGALLVGVVPVPLPPPPARFGQGEASLRQVAAIVAKASPRLLLTDDHLLPLLEPLRDRSPGCSIRTLDLLLRDVEPDPDRPPVAVAADDIAFLQFTSGSTSRPKGVRLSHANLVANVRAIAEHGLHSTPDDYCVSWLPLHHDMGLIGKVLVPMYGGMRGTLFMAPGVFLKRPLSWLRHISRQGGTITFAPNFAYDLCLARAAARPVEGLDLSSVRIAGCGAEPIRHEVLAAFAEAFAPHGFRAEALLPCYGLAEHTLAAAFSPIDSGVVADHVWAEALALGEAVPVDGDGHEKGLEAAGATVRVVSCGRVFPEHECRIVDADGRPLPERRVGEILLRGPSVTEGYFEDPEASAAACQDGWLRTGDLGYLAGGNLYVCGRTKDLIIVHGRNYHPQDLEWEAARTRGVRRGNVIAFGLVDPQLGRESVVIAAETSLSPESHRQLQHAIRARLLEALSLTVDHVLLVPAHTLPKTSSGKLQRARTRELFRAGALGPPVERVPEP